MAFRSGPDITDLEAIATVMKGSVLVKSTQEHNQMWIGRKVIQVWVYPGYGTGGPVA